MGTFCASADKGNAGNFNPFKKKMQTILPARCSAALHWSKVAVQLPDKVAWTGVAATATC